MTTRKVNNTRFPDTQFSMINTRTYFQSRYVGKSKIMQVSGPID